jgi:hypothetical protein
MRGGEGFNAKTQRRNGDELKLNIPKTPPIGSDDLRWVAIGSDRGLGSGSYRNLGARLGRGIGGYRNLSEVRRLKCSRTARGSFVVRLGQNYSELVRIGERGRKQETTRLRDHRPQDPKTPNRISEGVGKTREELGGGGCFRRHTDTTRMYTREY